MGKARPITPWLDFRATPDRRMIINPFAFPAVSGFAPTDLTGLKRWYKASSLSLSNSDPVSSFTDLSGLAKHAVQATGANQPLFKTSIINGLAAVLFDGSNDNLQFDPLALTNYTYFAVVKALNTSKNIIMAGAIPQYQVTWAGAPCFQFNSGGALATDQEAQIAFAAGSVNKSGAFHVIVADYTAGSQHIYVDGSSHATGTATGSGVGGSGFGYNWLGSIGVGALSNDPLNGYIAELGIYDNVKGSTDRGSLTTYLQGAYGL